jgi:peptidoglycan/LPS O-acetylase OafA/YrhL
MKNSSTSRIDDIEILRGFAVLFMIVQHRSFLLTSDISTTSPISGIFTFWTGVDLFFAISGFVIAKDVLLKLEVAAGDAEKFWRMAISFWIKRIYRIWPTSWLWVIVLVIASAVFRHTGVMQSIRQNIADLTAIIMQVQNFHDAGCYSAGGTWNQCGDADTWWSLSLEEQFYLVLPLAALCFRKRLPWFLGALILMQIFVSRPVWTLLWATRTDALCFGVLLAIFSRHNLYRVLQPVFMERRYIAIPVLAILLFLLAALPEQPEQQKIGIVHFTTGLIAIISIIFVFIGSFNNNYIIRNHRAKIVFLWVGTRSFAIYLIHKPAMLLTHAIWLSFEPGTTQFRSGAFPYYLVVWLLLTVGLSELNYRLIERPLRRKGREIARRIESAPVRVFETATPRNVEALSSLPIFPDEADARAVTFQNG